MSNKQNIVKFKKHWGTWVEGYLCLAEKGLLYFKKQRNIGKKKWFKIQKKALFDSGDGGMMIAIVWNIKHAIELLIKGLGIRLEKKYWAKHNLEFLLNDLKGKMSNYCIANHFDLFENIINKYYNCNFSDKTLYVDTENTLFKYPEIKNNTLDYSFVHDLERKDINLFLKDVHNLKRLNSLLDSQIEIFKSYQKLGLTKKEIEGKLLKTKNLGFKK